MLAYEDVGRTVDVQVGYHGLEPASGPLSLGLDGDPVGEYIVFEGQRRVPADKVELVRAGRAHIAAEIRRVVERVEVIRGEPVKVILKG